MNNRFLVILLFLLFLPGKFFAQDSASRINIIITIDDKVIAGSLANPRIIFNDLDEKREVTAVTYIAGNLSIASKDFDKLLSLEADSIILSFDFYEYCNDKQEVHNYEIILMKSWIKSSFLIVRLYNLEKRKYGKLFSPLEGRKYTYEVDYPSGSLLRVRKKNIKEKCN